MAQGSPEAFCDILWEVREKAWRLLPQEKRIAIWQVMQPPKNAFQESFEQDGLVLLSLLHRIQDGKSTIEAFADLIRSASTFAPRNYALGSLLRRFAMWGFDFTRISPTGNGNTLLHEMAVCRSRCRDHKRQERMIEW
ncbi:hypothetical protein CFIMG_000352RAa [Ceratocystis fimbriata CBS 114723]|uniref:Uncharacterized protein n=1 Tax=Ceratocystis fimbriata CBS 114723 TaxID=1035309 RepID=A0A2C5XIE8_9PEZI|nr:hypothetical protein CFIMG_000352RAa [Ceratocystis fimbriata CBS 114723]